MDVLVVDDEVSVGNFIGECAQRRLSDAVFNDSVAAFDHIGAHHNELALILTVSRCRKCRLDLAELARSIRIRRRSSIPATLKGR
jgi:hypothetical protein